MGFPAASTYAVSGLPSGVTAIVLAEPLFRKQQRLDTDRTAATAAPSNWNRDDHGNLRLSLCYGSASYYCAGLSGRDGNHPGFEFG